MAEIEISDTGAYYVGASVVPGEKIAFGDNGLQGNGLTVKNATLTYNLGVFTNDEKQPYKKTDETDTEAFTFGEATTTGVDQPKWSLTIYINRTIEADMITFGRLIYMAQTKGYKRLHSSTGNSFYDLIAYSKYGEKEAAGESTKTTTYVNVRIKNIQITQSADKKGLKCIMNLVETK